MSWVVDGVEDGRAETVIVEHLLDTDDAAEQVADLHADDGDRRCQRVAQDVLAHDLALRETLHRRRAGVVGLEAVDHAGPRHSGDVAEVGDRQCQLPA